MSETLQQDETILDLVKNAQAGDEAAFEQLVRQYYHRIHRWALAATGDLDDADDVTQDALVRVHRHLNGFDGRARFSTWLYQVTRSAAADLHRRKARRARLTWKLGREAATQNVEPVDRAGAGAGHDERTIDVVKTFLQELSGRQREVFDLVDLQGFTPAEVGRMLELEPVTVRSHLFRARKTIRRRILERHPELVEGYGP